MRHLVAGPRRGTLLSGIVTLLAGAALLVPFRVTAQMPSAPPPATSSRWMLPSWPVFLKPRASTKKRSVSATSRTESTAPWNPRMVTSLLISLLPSQHSPTTPTPFIGRKGRFPG